MWNNNPFPYSLYVWAIKIIIYFMYTCSAYCYEARRFYFFSLYPVRLFLPVFPQNSFEASTINMKLLSINWNNIYMKQV